MYTVGGLDVYVHKYMGPIAGDAGNADATLPVYDQSNPLFIEDLLLLENRDRNYDPDIYIMRGVYNQRDVDFDLTQFGLFLNNDTLFITFHYNDMLDTFGRKLMSGDVLEMPNLKDYNPLNADITKPLPRYYVIQDASFASEGFSQTWLPHLWRIKATPMVNAQEYKSILDKPFEPDNIWDPGNFYPGDTTVLDGNTYYKSKGEVPPDTPITDTTYWERIDRPTTIGDVDSTRNKDLELNDAILVQAHVEVPKSGYDVTKFYVVPTYEDGQPAPPRSGLVDMSEVTPKSFGYLVGYLTGDQYAPNGLPVTPGVSFPPNPNTGDYALRLDYYPNRLFRYSGNRWVKIDENVRTELDLLPGANTQRAGFVNNTYTTPTTDFGNIPQRQSLSEAFKINADNGLQGGNKPPNPPPPTQPGQPSS